MNVNGLKKLIRNERTDLLIDVCDATTFKDICQISVGNLIQQETEFDRWEVEWFHPYYCRGSHRQHLIEQGLPYAFDRTAVMMVSLESHFRSGVLVQNYLAK